MACVADGLVACSGRTNHSGWGCIVRRGQSLGQSMLATALIQPWIQLHLKARYFFFIVRVPDLSILVDRRRPPSAPCILQTTRHISRSWRDSLICCGRGSTGFALTDSPMTLAGKKLYKYVGSCPGRVLLRTLSSP